MELCTRQLLKLDLDDKCSHQSSVIFQSGEKVVEELRTHMVRGIRSHLA